MRQSMVDNNFGSVAAADKDAIHREAARCHQVRFGKLKSATVPLTCVRELCQAFCSAAA